MNNPVPPSAPVVGVTPAGGSHVGNHAGDHPSHLPHPSPQPPGDSVPELGGVVLRPATQADVPALLPLLATLGYPTTVAALAERLRLLAATGQDPVVVAERGGALLGVMGLHYCRTLHYEEPIARIMAIVVAEQAQGSGIGALLIRHAEAMARDAGCSGLELTSGLTRAKAHEFYDNRGFARQAIRFHKPV